MRIIEASDILSEPQTPGVQSFNHLPHLRLLKFQLAGKVMLTFSQEISDNKRTIRFKPICYWAAELQRFDGHIHHAFPDSHIGR